MAVEAESFGPEALILKEGEEGKRLFSLRDESGAGEEGGGEGDIGPSLLLSLSGAKEDAGVLVVERAGRKAKKTKKEEEAAQGRGKVTDKSLSVSLSLTLEKKKK